MSSETSVSYNNPTQSHDLEELDLKLHRRVTTNLALYFFYFKKFFRVTIRIIAEN